MTCPADQFCVYIAGSDGPLLVMLHGGGYSGLTWSLCAVRCCVLSRCLRHALDGRFAAQAQVKGCCTVAAYDCRGHGACMRVHVHLSQPTSAVLCRGDAHRS